MRGAGGEQVGNLLAIGTLTSQPGPPRRLGLQCKRLRLCVSLLRAKLHTLKATECKLGGDSKLKGGPLARLAPSLAPFQRPPALNHFNFPRPAAQVHRSVQG